MSLLALVLLPLLGALLPLIGGHRRHRANAAWAAAVLGVTLAMVLPYGGAVLGGEVFVERWTWLPSAGLDLALRLDGLSLLFVFLVLGIGLLIVLYSYYYLPERAPLHRFYVLFLLFAAAMLGLVLSENLLLLVLFWELTSLSSFLLIGFWNLNPAARQSARMALVVTGGGGLALLAGVLLLGEVAGGYDLTTVLAAGEVVQADSAYPWILGLILLGAFTKSAQFPFHFWLPQAMSAPTPVSAYLHSATMVKAGVFLLARLFPTLAGTNLWFALVTGVGLLTLLFGAFFALFRHDLKGLLAYSTISHLGLITMLFGLGTPLGAVAGVFHIINHAIFKASLFMAAGIVEHETESRDMRQLNGLFGYMPHTALLAMVAAAAMAGVPLLNGFLSKEMFFAETLHLGAPAGLGMLLPAAAVLSGVFALAYSLRFIHDVFFNGEPVGLTKQPHEPPRYMRVPIEVLVALCLLVGILPGWTVAPWLVMAAEAVVQGPLPYFDLAVWHGFTPPFFMSVAALVGGTLLYAARYWAYRWHDRLVPVIEPIVRYVRMEELAVGLGARAGRWLETGSLQRYQFLLVATVVALAAAGWLNGAQPLALPAPGGDPGSSVIMIALGLAFGAGATVVLRRRRFLAVLWLGVVGLGVALFFVRFAAPDLALTLLTVELVTGVLLLLALYFLPQRSPVDSGVPRRWRDAVLAGLTGVAVGGLLWRALVADPARIGRQFLELSLPEAGGGNVVNTILVDFRGFDTLGEITVLAIAAVGILTMLRGFLIPPGPELRGMPWDRDAHPLVLVTISRALLPLALVVSLFLLVRGHHEPGGGFVAGLVTGIGLILQYLASGSHWVRKRLHLRYRPLLAVGLGIATGTGMLAWVWGDPFLASAHGHFHLPVLGDIPWATTLLFDIGVYLTVVGAVTLILAELGRLGQKLDARSFPATGEGERQKGAGSEWPW
ncbi:monovalent cation/H+ antiporter subunit A [Thiohalorhabdus methylotrophus]|uniref:Monovalent cation/H+ antiporter subunit A n=1 Tax=Thiohalorhabdus methylotrophus TaxID=3242694 RepID=A0ABV4TX20_9GAMM